MKQKDHVKLFTMGLVILILLTINCGKSGKKSNVWVAEKLLHFLNNNKELSDSSFEVKPENRIVESIGNNYYRITFKDFTFNTDLTGIISVISKAMSKGFDFPQINSIRVEEEVIIYDPDTNDIPMYWLKNIKFEYEVPEFPGNNGAVPFDGARIKKFHGNIGKIIHKELDTDTRLKTGKKDMPKIGGNTFRGVLLPYDTKMENLKVGLTVVTKHENLISVFLEIEKLGNAETGQEDPGASMYIFDRDAPEPDINNTLKKGWSITDINYQVGRVKVSIEKNGAPWGGGAMDSVTYSLFIKPDDSGSRFKFGHAIEMKNLRLSIPGRKEVELLCHVKELRHEYSMKSLTKEATLIFLKLFRKFFLLRDLGHLNMQELMLQALQFQAGMYQSKALLNFSISPFKHYFGELALNIDMRLHRLLAMPEAKISVNLFKIDETINKLKEANLLSPGLLKTIMQTLEKYTVRQENGDVTTTIELKPDRPGEFFLNGKPMKLRTLASPQYRIF